MKLRTEGLTWREIDGETVILDLRSSMYLRTNATGTFLLKKLVEDGERSELVAGLAETYGLPMDQAADDVDAFLRRVNDQGLIETQEHGV